MRLAREGRDDDAAPQRASTVGDGATPRPHAGREARTDGGRGLSGLRLEIAPRRSIPVMFHDAFFVERARRRAVPHGGCCPTRRANCLSAQGGTPGRCFRAQSQAAVTMSDCRRPLRGSL
jgi:hypothetical protein